MNDNDVIRIVIGILNAGMVPEIPTINILQNYQPTNQGVPEVPVLYLHKITARRYGWQWQKNTFNEADMDFDSREGVWRTPTFQVSGLAQQDPSVPGLTASDIVELAADIMNSRRTLDTLQASHIGMQRISEVRLVYFKNDKNRFEQEPSFDFTLAYDKTVLTYKTPMVETIEPNGGPILL